MQPGGQPIRYSSVEESSQGYANQYSHKWDNAVCHLGFALEQEVKQLKAGAESGSMQLDETSEQLRKAVAEKEQMMVNTHKYIIKQEANTKAFQARIHDLEYWENFGKAVIFAAQNSEEIKDTLMSIPLVAGMLRGTRSP